MIHFFKKKKLANQAADEYRHCMAYAYDSKSVFVKQKFEYFMNHELKELMKKDGFSSDMLKKNSFFVRGKSKLGSNSSKQDNMIFMAVSEYLRGLFACMKVVKEYNDCVSIFELKFNDYLKGPDRMDRFKALSQKQPELKMVLKSRYGKIVDENISFHKLFGSGVDFPVDRDIEYYRIQVKICKEVVNYIDEKISKAA